MPDRTETTERVIPTNPIYVSSVTAFFNEPKIDPSSGYFSLILHALRYRSNAEHLKVTFDQMAKNRRLELFEQIRELDRATKEVQTAWKWMKISKRRNVNAG